MSKFIAPPGSDAGSLLFAARRERQQGETLLRLRRRRVVRRQFDDGLVPRDRGLRVAEEIGDLREVELRRRVARLQAHDALVELLVLPQRRRRLAEGGVRLLRQLLADLVLAEDLSELARRREADDRAEVERRLRLEPLRLGLLDRRLVLVEAGDLLEHVGVVRPQLQIVLSRGVRLVELAVGLIGRRERVPRCGILGMLLGPLQRLLDARALARSPAAEEVEVASQEVADARRTGADAEEDEARCEDDGKRDVDPFRVATEPGEGELVFPGGRPARGRLLPCLCLRGLAPRLCSSSGHRAALGYLGSDDGRRPVEVTPDRAEPRLRLLVAQRALDPGVVSGARV